MTATDSPLAELAVGLARRIAERGRAEERLLEYAFHEGAVDAGAAPVEQVDWRYFISRTLAAAGEPGTLDLLDRLSSGDATLRSLAQDRSVGLDGGLATVDRIGGLAAAGLVGRDLETGRVGLTGLGSAMLAFVREWERLAADSFPSSDGEPR